MRVTLWVERVSALIVSPFLFVLPANFTAPSTTVEPSFVAEMQAMFAPVVDMELFTTAPPSRFTSTG